MQLPFLLAWIILSSRTMRHHGRYKQGCYALSRIRGFPGFSLERVIVTLSKLVSAVHFNAASALCRTRAGKLGRCKLWRLKISRTMTSRRNWRPMPGVLKPRGLSSAKTSRPRVTRSPDPVPRISRYRNEFPVLNPGASRSAPIGSKTPRIPHTFLLVSSPSIEKSSPLLRRNTLRSMLQHADGPGEHPFRS